jgi:hypothetical protein
MEVQMALDKAVLTALRGPEKGSMYQTFHDEAFFQEFPTLAAFLTVTELGKGETRKTASLSIWADGEGWHACLSDRQNARKVFITATCWADILVTLEASVSDPQTVWRPDKPSRAR